MDGVGACRWLARPGLPFMPMIPLLKAMVLLVVVLLAGACSARTASLPTVTPPPPRPTPCPFQWAQEEYPDLSQQYTRQLQADVPDVTDVRAYGYGETTCNADGTPIFLPMQTDFDVVVSLPAAGQAAQAAAVTAVLRSLGAVPPEDTPGPQFGRVLVTVQSAGSEVRLVVPLRDVHAYLQQDEPAQPLIDALDLRQQLVALQ